MRSMRTMVRNGWLGVGILLLTTLSLPARAASPAAKWAPGDWWDVQLEQIPRHLGLPQANWIPSFRLHFAVTARSPQEIRVEVSTLPENRFNERLLLRYSPAGELLSAEIVDPLRVQSLGSAGAVGVFGMLGREAFVLKAPAEEARPAGARLKASSRLVRVALDETGRTAQVWRPGDAYWTQYETEAGLPQRATRVADSWSPSASGGQDPE
jgi:hypothetical protein